MKPAFARPADIIFEENVPAWTWMRTGDFGQDAGTINELQDGENVMIIWWRQSSLQVQYDVFCWSSDLEYEPTDEDYEKAEAKTLPVEPDGLLTTTWGGLSSSFVVFIRRFRLYLCLTFRTITDNLITEAYSFKAVRFTHRLL